MRLRAMSFALLFFACGGKTKTVAPEEDKVDLDRIAGDYVSLVLAAGRHDEDYVDAYFGPPELTREAERGPAIPPGEIAARAEALMERARRAPRSRRRAFLLSQIASLKAFSRRLAGEQLTLAEEARLLFGIELPRRSDEELEAAVRAAERALPGEGPLHRRVARFRARYRIPRDRVEAVARICIEESRRRTLGLIALPEEEQVELSLVHGAPWEAYLWYLGGYRSRIELDASRPIQLGAVCPLMSHEGYPGHHTYSVLLDQRLVRQRGRLELAVYPLYSPLSVLMEGTAEHALDIAFPGDEWRDFLAERIAPAAGFDEIDIDRYLEVRRALLGLRPALGEAAHRYFDEGADLDEIAILLERFGAISREDARRMFAAADRESPISYLFTYPVGRRLVAGWLGEGPDRRQRYFDLLLSPRPPRSLR